MRLVGIAQITRDNSGRRLPDEYHLYSFYSKAGDEKLYITNVTTIQHYRSGWEKFYDLPKSPSYQGFRLEFVYES